MDDKVLTQTAPATETPVQAVQAEVQKPQESIVTRASKVSLDNPKKADEGQTESIQFNVKDLDKISDPVARKLAEDAYKSFQGDYTRKTQALAQERKEMEGFKSKLDSMKSWNPERIQEELNNPSFVQAAQEYQRRLNPQTPQQTSNGNSELTEEEFSYLAPEQQKLYLKTKQMEQSLNIVNTRLQASEVEKEDMSLKGKYANYEPRTVNEIYQDMMSGRVQATREHLWKVVDYENAVQRAYQLGLEDRKPGMQEKVSASTQTNGYSVTPSSDTPVRLPKESGIEYFKRLALNNAAKLMKK